MLRHSASICKPHWHARGFTALSQLVQATEDALACLQSHGAEIHLSQNGRQIRPHDLKLEPVTLIFATRDANRYKEPRAASPDEVHGTGRYVEEIEGANGSHQGSKQSAGDIDVLSPAAALEQFINAGVFNKVLPMQDKLASLHLNRDARCGSPQQHLQNRQEGAAFLAIVMTL